MRGHKMNAASRPETEPTRVRQETPNSDDNDGEFLSEENNARGGLRNYEGRVCQSKYAESKSTDEGYAARTKSEWVR
jgi:hypothetical protein